MKRSKMQLPDKKTTVLYTEASAATPLQETTSALTDPTVTCGSTVTTTTHVIVR